MTQNNNPTASLALATASENSTGQKRQNNPVEWQPAPPRPTPEDDGLRRLILAGYLLVAAMVLMLLGWAANTRIAGAVVGGGVVVVENEEKLVQHPVGGVVGTLLVKEGSKVKAGDVIIRLNDTMVRSNLAVLDVDLSSLHARLARLKAERDRHTTIAFPPPMLAAPSADDLDAMRTETQFFESRRLARQNHRQQLMRKVDQLKLQIRAYLSIIGSRKQEVALVKAELANASTLLDKQLATRMAKTNLAQTVARLEGDYGNAINQKATLEAQISEIELQVAAIDHDMQLEVMRDLRDTEAKIAEDMSRRIAAEDQLARIDIRAPADGIVHELAVHTIGGVITPGEPIMKIVPESMPLLFQVRINPTDIDQVQVGQQATLRLPAFNRARTPELKGTISLIGADITVDRQSGRGFYDVRIMPDPDTHQRLKEKNVVLVPGMPVEAFMETGERSTLSYLIKPFTDQMQHAFREE